jgi:hypothetical protein
LDAVKLAWARESTGRHCEDEYRTDLQQLAMVLLEARPASVIDHLTEILAKHKIDIADVPSHSEGGAYATSPAFMRSMERICFAVWASLPEQSDVDQFLRGWIAQGAWTVIANGPRSAWPTSKS